VSRFFFAVLSGAFFQRCYSDFRPPYRRGRRTSFVRRGLCDSFFFLRDAVSGFACIEFSEVPVFPLSTITYQVVFLFFSFLPLPRISVGVGALATTVFPRCKPLRLYVFLFLPETLFVAEMLFFLKLRPPSFVLSS